MAALYREARELSGVHQLHPGGLAGPGAGAPRRCLEAGDRQVRCRCVADAAALDHGNHCPTIPGETNGLDDALTHGQRLRRIVHQPQRPVVHGRRNGAETAGCRMQPLLAFGAHG